MSHSPGHARRLSRGFSLVEVLIVIALMSIMTAVIVAGSGLLGGSRLRTAATLVLTGIRMGITRANSTGLPVRLTFDLENRRLILEESQGKMLRIVDEKEGPTAGAESVTEEEKAAEEEAKDILKGPRAPRAMFTAVSEFGFDGDEAAAGRELGKGVKILQVQTEHDSLPRTEGRAYLYFWPGGGTEKAIVQLGRDGEEDDILSIKVSRLTGRAKIVRGAEELEGTRLDSDFGEREEEQF